MPMEYDEWSAIFDEFNDDTTLAEMEAHLDAADDAVKETKDYHYLSGIIAASQNPAK